MTAWLYVWHAFASIAGAGLVAAVSIAVHRRCGLSHAARGYWLGAWALAALPAPLAIVVDAMPSAALPAALPVLVAIDEWSSAIAAPVGAAPAAAAMPSFALLLMIVYALGVAFGTSRWIAGIVALRRVLRDARTFDPGVCPTALRDECLMLAARGIHVLATERPVSAFAVCWPQPTIVVPLPLAARLDARQLRAVLRHEAAHLARRDPQWAALIRATGIVLWFNPLLRPLERRAQLAAELACDAVALAAEKNMRRAYAEAYLETLRMSMAQALPCPATAFSPQDRGSHRMRIDHIVHGDPRARKRPLLTVALIAAAVVAGGGLTAVQAATGGVSTPIASAGAALASAVPIAPAFAGPIIDGRISSPYGAMRENISAQPHNGIDLTAARGTAVHAPAAGTVLIATEHYAPAPNYGTVIVLDHGGGWQTVYAHLDRLDVAAGDVVAGGEAIGTLGISGKATGPHVHVEVLHDGVRIDPATVIAAPLVR